jgi:hypothetical protein
VVYRLNLAQPQLQKKVKAKCGTAAFPKMFTFREVGNAGSSCYISCPSLRTVEPPPCLPLDIKDSLKEDVRVF